MGSWKTLWKKLRKKECADCRLHKEAQSVCLMGQGPVPCRVMLIGEAPGYREDDLARPFSGAAGQLLDELLGEADIDRDDTYITNICKCRPPKNRTPDKDEIEACLPYLWREIKEVKPEFILLMGNTAMQAVIKKSGIGKHRGQWVEVEGIQILATYHPAAILRNPGLRNLLRSDLIKLNAGMTSGLSQEIDIHYESVKGKDGLKRALKACRDAKVLTYDLEFNGELVLCMGLYMQMRSGEECGFFIPLGHPQSKFLKKWVEIFRLFLPVIEKRPPYDKAIITGQNIKADNKHWIRLFDAHPKPDFDTMLASHVLDENTPNSLAYLSQVYANASNYKDEVDRANLVEEDLKKVETYNIQDAYYHLKVYYPLRAELEKDERLSTIFYTMCMPASRGFERAEIKGLWMNPKQLSKMTKVTRKRLLGITKKMQSYLPKGKIINWNAPQQIAWVLYDHLDLDIVEYTKTGKPSTAENCLVYLTHPFITALLEYRKNFKLLSTYLIPWSEMVDKDNRLHTSFKIHGTVTGRVSSEKPNIMNIPRESDVRSVVGAPPGWVLLEADYSQIELRIAAHMANERTMLEVYRSGGDIHITTAMSIVNLPEEQITKDQRKMAKAVNFGFIYGMSAKKFRLYAKEKFSIELTSEEAVDFRKAFFAKYRDLKPWHDRMKRIAHRLGYVRSILGRKRRLPDLKSSDEGVRAEAERQAINSPVQAVPPDLSFLALGRIMEKGGFWEEIHFISQVHDALKFEVREDVIDVWAWLIKHEMENPPLEELFNIELLCPIEVEVKVGRAWGKGEVWEEPEDFEIF